MSHVCYHCRNAGDSVTHSKINPETGMECWEYRYPCKLGINNDHMMVIYPTDEKEIAKMKELCPKADLRFGFQIGGHWKHTYFEACSEGDDTCLEMIIEDMHDFEFSHRNYDPDRGAYDLQFHICDFEQLEQFCSIWRKELEGRGWLKPKSRKQRVKKEPPVNRRIVLSKKEE